MSDTIRTRISASDFRRRTEVLHRAAGAAGDDFLQYLFGMALLYLDSQLRSNVGRRVESPATDASLIDRAAKLLTGKASDA